MIKGWILPFVYKSYSSDIKIAQRYDLEFWFFLPIRIYFFCSLGHVKFNSPILLVSSFKFKGGITIGKILFHCCFILLYFAYFAYFGLQRNWKLNYLKKKKQGLSFAEKQNCKQFALKSHPLMITLYLLLLFLFLFKLFNSFGFFAFFYHYYILYFCVKSHFCFTQI